MASATTLPTATDILTQLKKLGKDSYKQTLLRHGIAEPVLGVSIENLKQIQKRVKKDYQLALDLYDTGVYDAMYLAGLIADDAQMTKKDLQRWVDNVRTSGLAMDPPSRQRRRGASCEVDIVAPSSVAPSHGASSHGASLRGAPSHGAPPA